MVAVWAPGQRKDKKNWGFSTQCEDFCKQNHQTCSTCATCLTSSRSPGPTVYKRLPWTTQNHLPEIQIFTINYSSRCRLNRISFGVWRLRSLSERSWGEWRWRAGRVFSGEGRSCDVQEASGWTRMYRRISQGADPTPASRQEAEISSTQTGHFAVQQLKCSF